METEPQLVFLRQNRCDEVQGFLLVRPRSLRETEQAFLGGPPLAGVLCE